ncbi:MAG: hypothetical protein IEMM0008_0081 [bacterium]|nr:MAG: hypothetical protein IEMM0008_0081 [bacterium]
MILILISPPLALADYPFPRRGGFETRPYNGTTYVGTLPRLISRKKSRKTDYELSPFKLKVLPPQKEKKDPLETMRVVSTDTPSRKRKSGRFELGIGGGPSIFVFGTQDKYNMGILPTIYVNYFFRFGSGELGIGLSAGFNIFSADGTTTSSDNLVTPLQLDIRYVNRLSKSLQYFIRVSGGAALFLFRENEGTNTSVVQNFNKFAKYYSGGLGLRYSLEKNYGIGIEESFALFFEGSETRKAIIPSVLFLYVSNRDSSCPVGHPP